MDVQKCIGKGYENLTCAREYCVKGDDVLTRKNKDADVLIIL